MLDNVHQLAAADSILPVLLRINELVPDGNVSLFFTAEGFDENLVATLSEVDPILVPFPALNAMRPAQNKALLEMLLQKCPHQPSEVFHSKVSFNGQSEFSEKQSEHILSPKDVYRYFSMSVMRFVSAYFVLNITRI